MQAHHSSAAVALLEDHLNVEVEPSPRLALTPIGNPPCHETPRRRVEREHREYRRRCQAVFEQVVGALSEVAAERPSSMPPNPLVTAGRTDCVALDAFMLGMLGAWADDARPMLARDSREAALVRRLRGDISEVALHS